MPPLAETPVVRDRDRHHDGPGRTAGREGQRAVRGDGRLDREEPRAVVAHAEGDRLTGFVRGASRDIAVAQPGIETGAVALAEVDPPARAKLGASFTGFTVIVKVCGADVSTPPFPVPPASTRRTVTVADPNASAADVNESVPSAATVGLAGEQ